MRSVLCSLLLLAASAASAQTIDPPGAADGEALRGSVLVWHDATLFAEPRDDARPLQLATLDAARKDRVGHAVALKVVAAKGAFVEVELDGGQGCTASRVVVPDDLARVRLFVRRADLAPVLVKPYAQTFPDGTSLALGPGTPVVPTAGGTYVVALRGGAVEVDLPAASVGHAYVAPRAARTVLAGESAAIAGGTKATLGDRALVLGAGRGAPVERAGDSAIVAFEERCVEARVRLPARAVRDIDDDDTELDLGAASASDTGGSMMSLRGEFLLPRLTPLAVGERTVAVAAKPIFLHAEPSGKHACIQRAIRIASTLDVTPTDQKLRLCAPAARVARELTRRRSAARP